MAKATDFEMYENSFRTEVNKTLEKIDSDYNSLIELIDREFEIALQSMPANIKNMKLVDFLAMGGMFVDNTEEVMKSVTEESAGRKEKQSLNGILDIAKGKMASQNAKRGRQASGKKAGKMSATRSASNDASVARSTRSTRKNAAEGVPQTPSILVPKMGTTPFPLFTPGQKSGFLCTPGAYSRSVRPEEKITTLSLAFSEGGSPLMLDKDTTVINMTDSALVLNSASTSSAELLDNDSRKKVEEIYKQLGKMLKNSKK